MPEYFLVHFVIGADIKHVNISAAAKGIVTECGNEAAEKIDDGSRSKISLGCLRHVDISGVDAKED